MSRVYDGSELQSGEVYGLAPAVRVGPSAGHPGRRCYLCASPIQLDDLYGITPPDQTCGPRLATRRVGAVAICGPCIDLHHHVVDWHPGAVPEDQPSLMETAGWAREHGWTRTTRGWERAT